MGKITAEFILHREFVAEGEYNLRKSGINVRVTVTRIQRNMNH
jgi:hypothetical protein